MYNFFRNVRCIKFNCEKMFVLFFVYALRTPHPAGQSFILSAEQNDHLRCTQRIILNDKLQVFDCLKFKNPKE